jgi:hypothetical protein
MSAPSAIVAHTYDCLRALFSRLDETYAQSADDTEMSFVYAHTNNFASRLPFGLRCRKILQSHDYAADLTAKDHALARSQDRDRIVFDRRMANDPAMMSTVLKA